MAKSPALKVGLVSIAALAAAGGGLAWLVNLNPLAKGYELNVNYGDVNGLMPGSKVMLMGVKVGTVETVAPEGNAVRVRVHVDDVKTRILQGSRFMIMAQGLVGEKNLEIFPPKKMAAGTPLLADEDIVRGDDPTRLELVMDDLKSSFEEFKRSIDPAALQAQLKATIANLADTSASLKRVSKASEGLVGDFGGTLASVDALTRDTDRLIRSIRPESVSATVRDLEQLSSGLLATYNELLGSPRSRQANAKTLSSLRGTAAQLERLAGTLNDVTGDPNLQKDLKAIVKNLNVLTGGVSDASGVLSGGPGAERGFALSPRLAGVGLSQPGATGLAANLGLRLNLANHYYALGLEQIGEGPYLNVLFGQPNAWNGIGYHVGLIRSKIGAGAEYKLGDNTELLGQIYDPLRPTFRVGGTYLFGFAQQYGVLGQWQRTLQTGDNTFWLGVEWRPLD